MIEAHDGAMMGPLWQIEAHDEGCDEGCDEGHHEVAERSFWSSCDARTRSWSPPPDHDRGVQGAGCRGRGRGGAGHSAIEMAKLACHPPWCTLVCPHAPSHAVWCVWHSPYLRHPAAPPGTTFFHSQPPYVCKDPGSKKGVDAGRKAGWGLGRGIEHRAHGCLQG